MRNLLTFLNGKLILLVAAAIFLVTFTTSCSKGNGGPGEDPTPPPPTPDAKINSVSPSQSNVTHTYTGLNNDSMLVSWDVSNGSVTLNGETVPAVGSKKVYVGYSSKSFVLRATNSANKSVDFVWNVSIAVDPMLAKLTGLTGDGRSWKNVNATSQSPNGNITNIFGGCFVDDRYTFYLNGTFQTDYGSNTACAAGIVVNHFTLNPATLIFTLPDAIPVGSQPDRLVEFTSPTAMKHTYTKNGYTYVFYFEVV